MFEIETPVSRSGLSRGRVLVEIGSATLASVALGTGVVLAGGLEAKYKIALIVMTLLGGCIALFPGRRLLLLLAWVFVMPLGMEKVIDTGITIGPEFLTQYIVFNAGDVLLLFVGVLVGGDWIRSGRNPFRWSSLASVWGALLLWSAVSYILHVQYLGDGVASLSPLNLLTGARILMFIVLIQSAVRSQGELEAVLLVLAFTLAFQAGVVIASYLTGEVFNLARLTGGPSLGLNSFGDGAVIRATGTVGYMNEQAAYHTFCTVPLVALLSARSAIVRNVALVAVVASGVAILLTFARGAWIASGLAATLIAIVFIGKGAVTRAAWVKIAVLGTAASLFLAVMAYPIYLRLTPTGDEGATESRFRMISLALDLWRDHPFVGVGPGEFTEAGYRLEPTSFASPIWLQPGDPSPSGPLGRLEVGRASTPEGPSAMVPVPVHNRYLLSMAELGLPGVLLWCLLLVVLVKDARACIRSRNRFYQYFGVSALAFVIAVGFYWTVDLFVSDKSLQIVFFVPALICAAARHVRTSVNSQDAVRERGI